jgi:hypothetical protein
MDISIIEKIYFCSQKNSVPIENGAAENVKKTEIQKYRNEKKNIIQSI